MCLRLEPFSSSSLKLMVVEAIAILALVGQTEGLEPMLL
jgi:hypothetical protein